MSDINVITDSINRYAVAGAASDDAYTGLRDKAVEVYHNTHPQNREDQFRAECTEAEAEFMEINYSSDPDAKHTQGKRNGQWKFRTYLPAAYSSAKTELAKALGEGVDPTGKGKTELAKARKAATPTATTQYEKAVKHLRNLANVYREMPDGGDKEQIEDDIRTAFSFL